MKGLNKLELTETLFNHSAEGIIVADKSGAVRLVNAAAAKMLDYSIEELENINVDELVPDLVRSRHQQHRSSFNAHSKTRKMGLGLDLYARKKGGDLLPVEISLSPIDINGEKYVMAFIIDITLRKQIEYSVQDKQKELERVAAALIATNEELEKKVSDRTKVLQEAIRELEKSRNELRDALEKEKDLNDLKSRFISMASHEFRTPLTTILSSASLISEYNSNENSDKRNKHINRIKSAVNNLNDILSDFLSISKLEEGKVHAEYKDFDLTKLVNEVVMDMQINARPGQKINYLHKGTTEVFLDNKLIKNILINLINNSIKFTEENKNINVSTRCDAYTVSLEIQDEGIGISEEDQKHLFERFYRGKNAFNIQGTGLGLHIVGNYVDLMKGHIVFNSKLNKGTSIKITFPNQK